MRPLLSNKFVFTVTPTFPPVVTGFFLAFLESHYNNEPSFCQPFKPPEMTPYVNAQEILIFRPANTSSDLFRIIGRI